MNNTLQILHWVAGFIVLAEALNKLERTAPFARGLTAHERLVDGLKALAWCLLAIGAGGAVAVPLFGPLTVRSPISEALLRQLADMAVLVGFAVLIVRTRIKEG